MQKSLKKVIKLLFMTFLLSLLLSYLTERLGRQLLHFGNGLVTGKKYGTTELDKNGVPYVLYGIRDGKLMGKKRNPSRIGSIGIEHLENYRQSGDETYLIQARNCLKWMQDNTIPIGTGLGYESGFGKERHQIKDNFRSGLFQAKGLKIAIAFYQFKPDPELLEYMHALLEAFKLPADSGGFTYKESPDAWWYEEYASPEGDHPHILNGMMVTLIALKECAEASQDPLAETLFQKGVQSLHNRLPEFDCYGFSYYDLKGQNPGLPYHNVHWKMLETINEGLDDPVFSKYISRWKKSRFYPLYLRSVLIPYRLETVNSLMHFGFVFVLIFGGKWMIGKRKKN